VGSGAESSGFRSRIQWIPARIFDFEVRIQWIQLWNPVDPNFKHNASGAERVVLRLEMNASWAEFSGFEI
jgi:hypothetical protein